MASSELRQKVASLVEPAALRRFLDKHGVPKNLQKLVRRWHSGLPLTELEFQALYSDISEASSALENPTMRKSPGLAAFIWVLLYDAHQVSGDAHDKSDYIQARLVLLAKDAGIDRELIISGL